ncbi:MAG TPA: N,N-dimethylformamidase beta subunit family domain-containing protein, partial [Actinomycetota bacterium]|nr:N,N-dimethylformamidase beta subunit family domain-containing protein [Actinomycetota bacterium]
MSGIRWLQARHWRGQAARPAEQVRRRPGHIALATALTLVLGAVPWLTTTAASSAAANPCGPPVTSVIACENSKPGDPPSDWEITTSGDQTLQGYATQMSVDVGQTVSFKVDSTASTYHYDILRLGYYGGDGATKVASGLAPLVQYPNQPQPACIISNGATGGTGEIDCGNWSVSAQWAVPANAVSGIYLAHLYRSDTGTGSLIPFIVRNDASTAAIVVQADDETWEAYNSYGGNSLYTCAVECPNDNPGGYKGAFAVSYNRPFNTADAHFNTWFISDELPMIKFMEANGYDLTYVAATDMDSNASLLTSNGHKVFLSMGHDEYWSGNQRTNVTAAQAAGVNLAFFSGNEVFWKTRFAASIDGSNTPQRTLVCYKETHLDAPADPEDPPTWTGSWQDPRFSPPADGGRPENALTGQEMAVNCCTTDITVPSAYADLRIWANTAVAKMTPGSSQSVTLAPGVGVLGYEWDVPSDNGFSPPGLFYLSSTPSTQSQVFDDYGTNVTTATVIQHLTEYKAASGALVFGAGTVQWDWGIDPSNANGSADPTMQQATVNVFAGMGAQPATLLSGLVPGSASTDTTAPVSTITSPLSGATVSDGSAVTVQG